MKLHIVVTARPSWARVKHLVLECIKIFGKDSVAVLLVGPAVSKRYGDISGNIPDEVGLFKFPSLQDSDSHESIAISSLMGGMEVARFWSMNRPDAALIVADRTETLGVAVSAALMQIPLIHLQGGEVSGSIDDKVRDANTKLADFHLTTNDYTKGRLEKMGEDANTIEVVGCPSVDVLRDVIDRDLQPLPYSQDYGGVGENFSTNHRYGIIMFHPDTLSKENVDWVELLIDVASSEKDKDFYWFWFWPNPDHGTSEVAKLMRKAREEEKLARVRFIINLDPEVFITLVRKSQILIGNSSFGIREASYLGLPVINIGMRQTRRQRAQNVKDFEHLVSASELQQSISILIKQDDRKTSLIYGSGDAGIKSAQAISKWLLRLKKQAM